MLRREFKMALMTNKLDKQNTNCKKSSSDISIKKPVAQTEAGKAFQAKDLIRPSVQAAVTIQAYSKPFGEADLGALIGELNSQAKTVRDGNLARAEAVLMTQAQTLDVIFNHFAQLAIGQQIISHIDTFLRLGLKAQTQCRATLKTLAEIKNPRPTAFIKQQNVGVNQQVNNGELPEAVARAREISKNPTNELLEIEKHERLDTRTTGAASLEHSQLETVGSLDRP